MCGERGLQPDLCVRRVVVKVFKSNNNPPPAAGASDRCNSIMVSYDSDELDDELELSEASVRCFLSLKHFLHFLIGTASFAGKL